MLKSDESKIHFADNCMKSLEKQNKNSLKNSETIMTGFEMPGKEITPEEFSNIADIESQKFVQETLDEISKFNSDDLDQITFETIKKETGIEQDLKIIDTGAKAVIDDAKRQVFNKTTKGIVEKSNQITSTEKFFELSEEIMNEAEKLNVREEDRSEKGELLVFPEGPISNLGKQSELWWKIARTEGFKKFFGDWQKHPESSSKILDKNGEPLVIFRGQNDEQTLSFYEHIKNSGWSHKELVKGVFFSSNPEYADMYARPSYENRNEKGSTVCAFANARRPKVEPDLVKFWVEMKYDIIPVIIWNKLLRPIKEYFNSSHDSFCSQDSVYEATEIVLKNSDQILMIPSPVNKIKRKLDKQ